MPQQEQAAKGTGHSQLIRLMPRFKHVTYVWYPCSWVCVCALQTQVSAYNAGSSLWKV